jgi:copper transport protein
VVRAGRRKILLRGVTLGTLIEALAFSRRRSLGAAAIALCMALSPVVSYGAGRALFHATLLRSTPAANSHVAKPPETIRLVFSEQIVPELSHVTIIGPDAKPVVLPVATDPHDVHTLVARVGPSPAGRYEVIWHVLSADGHPVGGTFEFTADAGSAGASALVLPTKAPSTSTSRIVNGTATQTDTSAAMASPTEAKSIPVAASVLRGLGLGAMMASVGLLFFAVTDRNRRNLVPSAMVIRLTAVGAILFVAHMLAWLSDISQTGGIGDAFIAAALRSTPGRLEAARVIMAVLALWAVALARHAKIGLFLGACCLVVSGAIGHPAAIHPLLSIPSKIVHLLAGAIWLGGLIWLVTVIHREDVDFPAEARRVSSTALVCVIAILLSGVLQTWLFLNTPGDLIHSGYGRLALIKMAGLAVLIGLGAFNRFLLLPAVEDSSVRPALSRTVRQEIAIVIILIVVGGFLAYAPTPPVRQAVSSLQAGQPK